MLALYFALKGVNRTYMLIGTAATWLGIAVFVTAFTTSLFSVAALGDKYLAATSDAQRAAYVAAGDLARSISDVGQSVGFLFLRLSILLVGLVMLKSIFRRGTAYLGIVIGISGIAEIAVPLGPIPDFLSLVWFFLMGFKLYQLGR